MASPAPPFISASIVDYRSSRDITSVTHVSYVIEVSYSPSSLLSSAMSAPSAIPPVRVSSPPPPLAPPPPPPARRHTLLRRFSDFASFDSRLRSLEPTAAFAAARLPQKAALGLSRGGRERRFRDLKVYLAEVLGAMAGAGAAARGAVHAFLGVSTTGLLLSVSGVTAAQSDPSLPTDLYNVDLYTVSVADASRATACVARRFSAFRSLHLQLSPLLPPLLCPFPSRLQDCAGSRRRNTRLRRHGLDMWLACVNGAEGMPEEARGMLADFLGLQPGGLLPREGGGEADGAEAVTEAERGSDRDTVASLPTPVPAPVSIPDSSPAPSISSSISSSPATFGGPSSLSNSIMGPPSSADSSLTSTQQRKNGIGEAIKKKTGKAKKRLSAKSEKKAYLKNNKEPTSISDYLDYLEALHVHLKPAEVIAAFEKMGEISLPPDDFSPRTARVTLATALCYSANAPVLRAAARFLFLHTRPPNAHRIEWGPFVDAGGLAVVCYAVKKSLRQPDFVADMLELLRVVFAHDRKAVKVLPAYARACLHQAGGLFEFGDEATKTLQTLLAIIDET